MSPLSPTQVFVPERGGGIAFLLFVDKLVNIFEKEMDKNEVNVDSILERLDTEMNGWSLSEPVKTTYRVQVMDIIEVAIPDESENFSAINQIRNMLSLNFNVKSQAEIKD